MSNPGPDDDSALDPPTLWIAEDTSPSLAPLASPSSPGSRTSGGARLEAGVRAFAYGVMAALAAVWLVEHFVLPDGGTLELLGAWLLGPLDLPS